MESNLVQLKIIIKKKEYEIIELKKSLENEKKI